MISSNDSTMAWYCKGFVGIETEIFFLSSQLNAAISALQGLLPNQLKSQCSSFFGLILRLSTVDDIACALDHVV